MACSKRRYMDEGVLSFLKNDTEEDVIPEDSSSDEEDLIQPERDDTNGSDPDYLVSSLEMASTSVQPPWSCGRSLTALLSQPSSTEKRSPPSSHEPRREAATVEEKEETWHSAEDQDQKSEPFRFMPARPPGPTVNRAASCSPFSLFQLFFSTSVVRTIVDNTNTNAAKKIAAGKKFSWEPLTVKEFYIFMAVSIFSGLINVHDSCDSGKRQFPFPQEKMSRCRFETILWLLHLSDPKDDEDNDRKKKTAGYDRLFKIKPLYTDIVTACKTHFQPHQNICFDERVVATTDWITFGCTKRNMRDKSPVWGYKLFVLADSSTGYTWNFSVSTSQQREVGAIHGPSHTAVVDLLPFSVLGGGYTLYVDSFYTSPDLFRDLYKRGIGCCGTITKNCVGFPQTDSNNFPEKPKRGDIRWIRKDNLLFVKWFDTREVMVCSTVHGAFSGKTVQHRAKEDGVWTTKTVSVPDAVTDYEKNVGGVDLSDVLIGYYTFHHKSIKWYKSFFYHFVDIAVVNSFLLHKELFRTRPEVHTQKAFRETLVTEMLRFAEDSAPQPSSPKSTPTPTLTCMPRYYGSDATASRRYCRRCQEAGIQRVKTPIYCRNCNVPLCLTSKKNCFEQWHDNTH